MERNSLDLNLSKEQLETFCSSILLSDIIDYVNSHQEEYNEFLRNEQKKV